MIRTRS